MALERSGLVAEWVELTGDVSTQVASKPQGGRPEGRTRKASRELGIELTDAQRSLKVASLSPEAQEVAQEVGLDDN